MSNSPKLRLPVWAIMLDVAGTLLVAAGLFGLFAGESVPAVEALNLEAFAIPLIILGVLLMVPLIVFLVKR